LRHPFSTVLPIRVGRRIEQIMRLTLEAAGEIVNKTMRARSILVFALGCLFALPLATQAALYKWVDENGVVNYGDTPPAGTKEARQLDEATSSLSVFPGMSKDELARLRARDEQARIERLEREVAELRARPPAPAPVYDAQAPTYVPAYVPLVVSRRLPPRQVHSPVHGAPVQKTPPFRSMKLER
jgi:hypothetical protein